MGAVVQANVQLPAHIARLAAIATAQLGGELTGGVQEGFGVISYRGKVWRIKKGGVEEMYLNEAGDPMPTIEVVLVQANPSLSKIYYEAGYVEGNTDAPKCFSNLGDVPDPSVQEPQARNCQVCPKAVWGSRISDAGKKLKACQDSRRMAVCFASDLYNNASTPDDVPLYLLRVPPASLNVIKEYQEKQLGPRGIPFFSIVTRIGFDPEATHPQFRLKAARFVNEEESEAIEQLRGCNRAQRILAEAQDHTAGESHGAGELTEGTAPEEPEPAPAPPAKNGAAKPARAAVRPATDEEAGAATLQHAQPAAAAPGKGKPAAAKPAVAAAPAAAKPAVAKPAPAKAAPAAQPVQAAAVEPEATGDDGGIDAMLDSILNG